jgi:hypothetical protein
MDRSVVVAPAARFDHHLDPAAQPWLIRRIELDAHGCAAITAGRPDDPARRCIRLNVGAPTQDAPMDLVGHWPSDS